MRSQSTEATYGIPPEQVVGTAAGVQYGYGPDGKPVLTKEPRLLLNDDQAMKQGWIVIRMKDDWKRIFAFDD